MFHVQSMFVICWRVLHLTVRFLANKNRTPKPREACAVRQIPMVWLQATSLWLGLDTLLLGSIESLKKAKFPKMDDWKTRHYLKSVLFWCPHVEYTPVTLSFVTLLLREWGGQTCRSFTAPDTILDVFCLRLEQPVYSQNFSEYIPWWYNYIRIRDTLYVLFR